MINNLKEREVRKLAHIFIKDGVLYDCPFANTIEELRMFNKEFFNDKNIIIIENNRIVKENYNCGIIGCNFKKAIEKYINH